jgi:mitochondrial fission protein ELM1
MILVITDNKTGNNNQSIALAKRLNLPYNIIKIEYNFLGNLPSWLLSLSTMHIKKSSFRIENENEIIITAGRRTAALALYLKRRSKKYIKIIQITNPNLNTKYFDLIISPNHDECNDTHQNTIKIIGSLTNISQEITGLKKIFEDNYPDIGRFIAVIVGGSTKSYKLTADYCYNLGKILDEIIKDNNVNIFFTFSRRTPSNIKDFFYNKYGRTNMCYDPKNGGYNPYPGMLGSAEFVIATPDSISMCSEIAGSGKPFYIYKGKNFNLKKHQIFIQSLFDLGIAKDLDSQNELSCYSYNVLDEMSKVIMRIKNKLL